MSHDLEVSVRCFRVMDDDDHARADRVCAGIAALTAERDAAMARAEKAEALHKAILEVDWGEARAREAEVDRLCAALTECADDLDDACEYKGKYLSGKHGDAENVARYRAIAAGHAATGTDCPECNAQAITTHRDEGSRKPACLTPSAAPLVTDQRDDIEPYTEGPQG